MKYQHHICGCKIYGQFPAISRQIRPDVWGMAMAYPCVAASSAVVTPNRVLCNARTGVYLLITRQKWRSKWAMTALVLFLYLEDTESSLSVENLDCADSGRSRMGGMPP